MTHTPSMTTVLLVSACALAGCATTRTQPVDSANVELVEQVYVYPAAGQSAPRQDRDRYECHLEAVKQSGFDPSLLSGRYQPRYVLVSAPPPGTNTVGGAVAGALIGAAVAGPHDAGAGALIGAAAGAVVGASADSAHQQRVTSQRRDAQQRNAALEQRAGEYRRAISACLEGRGYTVS